MYSDYDTPDKKALEKRKRKHMYVAKMFFDVYTLNIMLWF